MKRCTTKLPIFRNNLGNKKENEKAKISKVAKPKSMKSSLSNKIQQNVVDENPISEDPQVRKDQEEKASYIQKMFRDKQSKKMNPKLREQ